jgi:hypothetical protein
MCEASSMIYPDGTYIGRYSTIGDNVLEKVAGMAFTKSERMVLSRIMVDTIGQEERKNWKKESVRRIRSNIPIERFEDKTCLLTKDIKAALDNLEKRSIIRRQGDDITFNYHLEQWK